MPMKPEKTYFIMTNSKGDYGCITFTDYEMYTFLATTKTDI